MATVAAKLDDVFQAAAELDARLASVAALLARLESNGATSPDDSNAMAALLTAPALTAPALVRRVYRDLWSALADMNASDWQRAGELLFALWDKCLAMLRYVEESADLLDKKCTAVPVDRFKVLLTDTQRERNEAFNSWPWLSAEEEAESLDELARGGAVPVETILRELQSGAR